MIRLIILIALAYLAYRAWRSIQVPQSKQTPSQDLLKPCEFCKLHLPIREGITFQGQFFCCQEHLEQFKQENHD